MVDVHALSQKTEADFMLLQVLPQDSVQYNEIIMELLQNGKASSHVLLDGTAEDATEEEVE